MIATLRLEAIGDNYARLRKQTLGTQIRVGVRGPREHMPAILAKTWRPWVAEIRSVSRTGKLERVFLEGLKDYRDANGAGSRGIYLTYVLREDTLYEVNALESWSRQRRYFCRAVGGKVVEMTTDEAMRWLEARERAQTATTPPTTPPNVAALQRVVRMAATR